MEFMKQKFSKALALVICLIMTVMSMPMSAFAAVASDLPTVSAAERLQVYCQKYITEHPHPVSKP